MQFTEYFWFMRQRPDRAYIKLQWIGRVVDNPERQEAQADGRFRLWASIGEMDGRYLRVVLLPDRRTVHNAFFDRSFRP